VSPTLPYHPAAQSPPPRLKATLLFVSPEFCTDPHHLDHTFLLVSTVGRSLTALASRRSFAPGCVAPRQREAVRGFATMAEQPLHSHVGSGGVQRLADKLEKPLLDNRSYRVVKLSNELEALLIHDPDTDKASAAMDINVGSFSDAEDLPGMAHAVEHLLFMGTEKVRVDESWWTNERMEETDAGSR